MVAVWSTVRRTCDRLFLLPSRGIVNMWASRANKWRDPKVVEAQQAEISQRFRLNLRGIEVNTAQNEVTNEDLQLQEYSREAVA
jgi:hypothetical protein